MQSRLSQSLVSISILVAVGVGSCTSTTPNKAQALPITAEVKLGTQTVSLEVARTPEEQAIGLMFREALADDRGMLFLVDPPRPVTLWMKNVEFPLDMLFLAEGEIVAIEANIPPCTKETSCPTYGPKELLVDTVIEVRGGLAEDLGVQVGDVVDVEKLID